MRGLVIFAVLLGVVAGYRPPSYAASAQQTYTRPKDSTDVTPSETPSPTVVTATASTSTSSQPSTTFLTTIASLPSTTKPSSTAAEPPVKDEPELMAELPVSLPSLLPDDDELPKRRVVTYDQRQEGQYNIRADLENFMIVLIPPSPADGLSLLDLLTKSSLRRNSHTTKGKRKHYSSSTLLQPGPAKYRQTIKSGNNNQNFNYLPRQQSTGSESGGSRGYSNAGPQTNAQPIAIVEGGPTSAQRLSDFIEGRTPYHVDISSNDDEQLRLNPDQVDVLPPPPYPLAYQHLIKPFHLEAEPTVIQALPPAHASGNFLETYNQLLASSLQENVEGRSNSNGPTDGRYYRVSRAIRGDTFLDSNRVTSSNSLGMYPARRSHQPIYRSDLAFGAGSLYPPIDVPHFTGYLTVNSNSRNLELNADDDDPAQNLDDSHLGEIIVPPSLPAEDDLELDLHSVSFIDSEAKALLSDSMERCAPGRRRDSYGVCREIEGY